MIVTLVSLSSLPRFLVLLTPTVSSLTLSEGTNDRGSAEVDEDEIAARNLRAITGQTICTVSLAQARSASGCKVPSLGKVVDDYLNVEGYLPDDIQDIHDAFRNSTRWEVFELAVREKYMPQGPAWFVWHYAKVGQEVEYRWWDYCPPGFEG